MPTSISMLLLFLTCTPHPLSSTPTTHNRRTLHQPFFPQDSIPPSQHRPQTSLLHHSHQHNPITILRPTTLLPLILLPTTATTSPSLPSPFASQPTSPPSPHPPNPNMSPPSSSLSFSSPLSSSSSSSSSTSARKKQHSNFCSSHAKIAKWVSTEKNERIVDNHHNIVINLKQTEKSAEYDS